VNRVSIVGAGLAGCEATLQCAKRGIEVELFEMRPATMTEAHRTADVAELVCSNSLKSTESSNAHGLLKQELRICESVLLQSAERTAVPGGKALVVDRVRFSEEVAQELSRAKIDVKRQEVTELPDGPAIVATGPLTSTALADQLTRHLGKDRLFFYDAIAPILSAESIDTRVAFQASRYEAGQDYLNCPLDEQQYRSLVSELLEAELHPVHEFESTPFFEACLPVEELARRGPDTLAFGPLKPVGLPHPRTGKRPFAVVQLRRENAEGTMYNLVGFQTRLRHAEQERVFRLIPGLEQAEFLRFGSIHRNTFLDSPNVLLPTLQTRARPDLLIAGQLTGVEGYVESIAAGLVAGINGARLISGSEPVTFPHETMLGGLLGYVAGDSGVQDRAGPGTRSGLPGQSGHVPRRFQPMNANFGLLPALDTKARGKDRKRLQAERALDTIRDFARTLG